MSKLWNYSIRLQGKFDEVYEVSVPELNPKIAIEEALEILETKLDEPVVVNMESELIN